jgi:hypothetical protein
LITAYPRGQSTERDLVAYGIAQGRQVIEIILNKAEGLRLELRRVEQDAIQAGRAMELPDVRTVASSSTKPRS